MADMIATPKPKEVHLTDKPPPPRSAEDTVRHAAETWRAIGFDVSDEYDLGILVVLEMSTRPRMSYAQIARELHIDKKTVSRRVRQFNARMRKALAPFLPTPPPTPKK